MFDFQNDQQLCFDQTPTGLMNTMKFTMELFTRMN